MAVFALINEFVSLNGVDHSDHIRQATLTAEATVLDASAMGVGWVQNITGLKSGQLQLEFNDDMVAGEIDALLWPLFGTVVPFVVRPDAGVVSATNPNYSGSIVVSQFVIGGSINEVARKGLTFPVSGALARATS